MGLARIAAEAERLRLDLYPKRRLSPISPTELAEAQALLFALSRHRPDLFAALDNNALHTPSLTV